MKICPECGEVLLDVETERFGLEPGEKLLVKIPPPIVLSRESCVQLRASLTRVFTGLPADTIVVLQEGLKLEVVAEEQELPLTPNL